MVARDRGYFGAPFKGFQGVPQGDPLSPTIFNVVVEAMAWHWITVVATREVGSNGFVRAVQRMASLFYTYGDLLDSTWPDWLKE